jgi:hypothetical protein
MVQVKITRAWPRDVGVTGKERHWPSISLGQAPSLKTGSTKAAAEAFLEHEFDRMRSWQRLRESELEEWRDAPGLDGSAIGITVEEIRQIPECCPERVEDPSRRPPDARAARVFSRTGVSPQR